MSDSSNTPPSEETSEVTPSPKIKTENLTIKWIEVISKALIAAAGVGIAIIGHQYQQSSTNTQLLLQQESGDISIRAEMFGKITERLMKPKENTQSSLVEDALLAQVLALNFHELIELKPLMLFLDRQLEYKSTQKNHDGKYRKDEYLIARNELKSIANRIRDRQVASLTNSNQEQSFLDWLLGKERRDGRVEYITATQRGYKEHISCASNNNGNEESNSNSTTEVKKIFTCLNSTVYIDDFEQDKFVSIAINKINDTQESFEITMMTGVDKPPMVISSDSDKDKPINSDSCPSIQEANSDREKPKFQKVLAGVSSFSVTNYDFPLTDNTLKPNGDRYAVFVDKVCRTNTKQECSNGLCDNPIQSVRLGLLFFPEDYYPTRERPINTRQLKEKIEIFD